MNWYKLFYWISAADGIKETLKVFGIVATILAGIVLLVYSLCSVNEDDKQKIANVRRTSRRLLRWMIPLTLFVWIATSLIPSKKDALMIVAGGAVGNFITSDSSAKQIPAEVMNLLREKIRSEINELHTNDVEDTLKGMTKERLIEIIKSKK